MSEATFERIRDDAHGRPRFLLDRKYVALCLPEHPLAVNVRLTVLEHRLALHEAGIDPAGFDVHHRNGDTHDNRLANLELLDRGEHQRRHAAQRRAIG